MSSKSLGLTAVGLSVAAIPVLYGVRFFPASLSLAGAAVLVAAITCSILAAQRGSKLWLLLTVWPIVCGVALMLSIRAE